MPGRRHSQFARCSRSNIWHFSEFHSVSAPQMQLWRECVATDKHVVRDALVLARNNPTPVE